MFNIYAYDAYYLELAKRLKIPLLTLDNQMKDIASALKNRIKRYKIMKIYNYTEAQSNLSAVLNTALMQDVIVKEQNGRKFKIVPIKENTDRSPFDVSGINTDVTTEELVEILKQSRKLV
jgi:hypothetical protein